jgi:hypothetical protein
VTANETRLVDELRNADKHRAGKSEALQICEIARKTRSAATRDAAALALADLRAKGARDLLLELLKRPSTKGHRGTLLYALETLDAEVPLASLVDIIADDTYEAREQALDLIENGQSTGSVSELQGARAKLTAVARSRNKHASHAAKQALKLLADPA